jgi:hypothetical protein
MPRVIQPPGGIQPAPDNTTLCQVMFGYGLNYKFISSEQQAASQIFDLLPIGVAASLKVRQDQVAMRGLEPVDTTPNMGFISTSAQFWVHNDMVAQLTNDIHDPQSKLYNTDNDQVNTLTSMIVSTFPVVAGPNGNGQDSQNGNNGPGGPSSEGAAPFEGDSAGGSAPVKSSSVIIGCASAAGAVLYGAAMVFVARRYRKRKAARHNRTSSVTSASYRSGPGYMSGPTGGSLFMAGGRGYQYANRDSRGSGSSQGRSIRTQQISAPVMAENSLGWN